MRNGTASLIKKSAKVMLILGIIGGIILGNTFTNYYSDFNYTVMLSSWISVFIFYLGLAGLAEIIELLESNLTQQKMNTSHLNDTKEIIKKHFAEN